MVLDMPYFRKNALWMAVVATGIVFVLWNIPQLDFLLYPFRLFVTFVHEAGHSLAATFTGGSVETFTVLSDGTGWARTRGGNLLFILPAGYLGAAFFGAGLFYAVNTVPFPRKIALALGTFMVIIALFMGAQGIALIIGVLTGVALIFLSLRASIELNMFVLNFLAIITGLNAALDVIYLVGNVNAGLGDIQSDAAALAMLTRPLPAAFWALLWALIAVGALGASVYYSIIRRMRHGEE